MNSSTYKYPWARVLCYRGGQGKGGKLQLQEVVRYPNQLSHSSSNQYCGHTYPSLVLPLSRVHLKLGGCSTRPGRMISILAIPADFPLALAFTHTLSRHAYDLHRSGSAPQADLLRCCKALSVCVENTTRFLSRLNCPLPLKELVLYQLASVLWTLANVSPEGFTPWTLLEELLQRTTEELTKEFESECSNFPFSRGKTKIQSIPPPGSIGDRGLGKFSTYFQALLEFSLAGAEYQQRFHESESSSIAVSPLPSEAGAASGKESAKRTKRVRSRKGGKKEVEVAIRKKDDWLAVVGGAAGLLRGLALEGGEHVFQRTPEISSLPAHPNSRLVVITSLDHRLDIESTEKTIRKVCHVHGGLYKDQLYLPVEEIESEGKEEGVEEGAPEVSATDDHTQSAQAASESPAHEGGEKEETLEETTDSSQPEESSSPAEPSSTADPTHNPTHQLQGHAILELCCSKKVSTVSSALLSGPALQSTKEDEGSLSVSAVGDELKCGDNETANKVLLIYLKGKLFTSEDGELTERAKRTFAALFATSLGAESERLAVSQITGDLHLFLSGYLGDGKNVQEYALEVCRQLVSGEAEEKEVGPNAEEEGGKTMDVEQFLKWVMGQVARNEEYSEEIHVRSLWKGLFACGYDLHFERLVVALYSLVLPEGK